MPEIKGLKCLFNTKSSKWGIELALGEGAEQHRFDLKSGEDVETFLEAFEESTAAHFDEESGEVAFTFEYAFDDEEDDGDEEEDDREEEEDDEEEEDEPAPPPSRKS